MAQLVARMVWDHEVGGSSPLTPTISLALNGEAFFTNVAPFLTQHRYSPALLLGRVHSIDFAGGDC